MRAVLASGLLLVGVMIGYSASGLSAQADFSPRSRRAGCRRRCRHHLPVRDYGSNPPLHCDGHAGWLCALQR